jgi:hypothetical protein
VRVYGVTNLAMGIVGPIRSSSSPTRSRRSRGCGSL